jgi:hypothetical protein
MKRLDKPTKHQGGNLLNIEKKTVLSSKLLLNAKLSAYLRAEPAFYCSHVFEYKTPKSLAFRSVN